MVPAALICLDGIAGREEVVVSGRVEGMRPSGRSLEGTFACCVAFRFTRTALSSLENQFGITDLKKTFIRALSS